MFHVLRRDESTLRPIIQRNVAPHSIIMSDQWKAYHNISHWQGFNYIHRTVNHSVNFVNPVDGTDTQRIESNWGWVKNKLIKSKNQPNIFYCNQFYWIGSINYKSLITLNLR